MKPTTATTLPIIGLLALVIAGAASGQGKRSDHERADALPRRLARLATSHRFSPHWSEDGNSLWFEQIAAGETRYRRVDALSGDSGPAFDHDLVARLLGKELGGDIEPRSQRRPPGPANPDFPGFLYGAK